MARGFEMMTTSEVAAIKKVFKPGVRNLGAGIVLGLLVTAGGGSSYSSPRRK